MKNLSINFLILLIPLLGFFRPKNVFSQSRIDIHGQVLNKSDSSVLPYIHVNIQNTALGTTTDEQGRFLFYVDRKYLKDSLSVSAIGFETYTALVEQIVEDQPVTIYLDQSYRRLPEITVTDQADSALSIVKEAIKRIPKNYPRKKYQLKGFFRESSFTEQKYTRVVEAAITVEDRGYQRSKWHVKIDQLRKSDDMRELNWITACREWAFEKNVLIELLHEDVMHTNDRQSIYAFIENFFSEGKKFGSSRGKQLLSSAFTSGKDFDIEGITNFEGQEVYLINFESFNQRQSLGFGVSGQMAIRTDNYALINFESHLKLLPPPVKNGLSLEALKKDKEKIEKNRRLTYDGEHIFSRKIIYREYEGKYYPSYYDVKHRGGFLNNSRGSSAQRKYLSHSQFMVSQIVTNRSAMTKIRRKERMPKDVALHNLPSSYDPSFWKTYNFIQRNPLEKPALSQLEESTKLEEQFTKNEEISKNSSRQSMELKDLPKFASEINNLEYLPSLNDTTLKVTEKANENQYGYDPKSPIMLGTTSVYANAVDYPRFYLNALRGPNGEKIHYRRVESCCPFITPNSRVVIKDNETQFSLLDKFEIWWEGSNDTMLIYFNLNDEGKVQVPKGLTSINVWENPSSQR